MSWAWSQVLPNSRRQSSPSQWRKRASDGSNSPRDRLTDVPSSSDRKSTGRMLVVSRVRTDL